MTDTPTHPRAWPLDESGESVLVACGPIDRPHWWVICPATATLYFDEVEADCHDGAWCDHDDVHRFAVETWRKVRPEDAER